MRKIEQMLSSQRENRKARKAKDKTASAATKFKSHGALHYKFN